MSEHRMSESYPRANHAALRPPEPQDETLVERVARAMAETEGMQDPHDGHRRFARASIRVMAKEFPVIDWFSDEDATPTGDTDGE